ncbi:MAG: ribosome small subunit-dependent GTPase A [Gloeomargaritaceae cyanobacterium C42_A2020_066]|nr:ribosome small subunit-dependent GTPase A [Gloeomargaritaceae cyanobacterium C42_A2020_066]
MGTVVAAQANFYEVYLAHGAVDQTPLLCTGRARLLKTGRRVMVGDRVWLGEADLGTGRGVIAGIAARQSEMAHPPVANATCLVVVVSLAEPPLEAMLLSRFLVHAEAMGLGVQVALTKVDLVESTIAAAWETRLAQWGYQPFLVSTPMSLGLEPLRAALVGETAVLCGPSGVGKSSLINALVPTAGRGVGAVSARSGRGCHTTRHVSLLPLPAGGFLVDTPGFNQPLLRMSARGLGDAFPEIRQRLRYGTCEFRNCQHHREPGCQVRGDWERYAHYCTWLQECLAQEAHTANSAGRDAGVKYKSGPAGRLRAEPRLTAEKYRRLSRRRLHQEIAQLDEPLSPED